ncbi:hypothetical protein [Streptomyces sp. NPDC102264]|uniref:hypothetical protein n=1 Tax=Streptomyces sp. NPDC102264 TaxID=3366149 RepID=UPI00382B2933
MTTSGRVLELTGRLPSSAEKAQTSFTATATHHPGAPDRDLCLGLGTERPPARARTATTKERTR